uniref:Secreted protein n=1 Tax=Panagrolaimus sp. PS1159 TaxID=55785 RepID=A0AC35FAW7_9BILA
MKLCFKILFCFFLVLSLGFLDASNDSLILDGNLLDEVNGLLSDEKHGKVVGSDVELSGSGPINLTLDNGELVFKVCGCVEK